MSNPFSFGFAAPCVRCATRQQRQQQQQQHRFPYCKTGIPVAKRVSMIFLLFDLKVSEASKKSHLAKFACEHPNRQTLLTAASQFFCFRTFSQLIFSDDPSFGILVSRTHRPRCDSTSQPRCGGTVLTPEVLQTVL